MVKPEDNELGPGTMKVSAARVSANEVEVTVEHTGAMERAWKNRFVADNPESFYQSVLHWLNSLLPFEDTQVFTASDSAETSAAALVNLIFPNKDN